MQIHPSLRHLAVSIDSLIPDPRNARLHDGRNLEAIRASLQRFGQRLPVVVQREGRIVRAGNGRLQAAKDLGWTEIAALIVDEGDVDAIAYGIADNRTAELAEWDVLQLKSLLAELPEVDLDLDRMLAALEDEVLPQSRPLPERDLEPVSLEPQYSVLVKCRDESEQTSVLGDLQGQGRNVRAMVVGFPKEPSKPEAEVVPVTLKPGEIEIVRQTSIVRTPRVLQLEGLFDVPPTESSKHSWRVSLTLDRPWHVGLIVGPSGSGKSTVARELFGSQLHGEWDWPTDRAIVDGFPASLSMVEITGLLSSVGFSSPPAWLKPFHVLSNGEQFRVNLARTLAEQPELCVVDEFTSVVDRTVAQIGSAAVSKAVRRSGRKFVAVTCHADVVDWLQPDWVLEMPLGNFSWRCLPGRPALELTISRVESKAWHLFRPHHYLNHGLNPAARCFVAEVRGRPAAFTAVLHHPYPGGGCWREHRTVCLPDFQGVGIGNAMSELIAGAFAATGKDYRSTTSHPAMIRHRLHSPLWSCTRKPTLGTAGPGDRTQRLLSAKFRRTAAVYRATASFVWRGEKNLDAARRLGISQGEPGA